MAAPRLMQSVRALPAAGRGCLRSSSTISSSHPKQTVLKYLREKVSAAPTVRKWRQEIGFWVRKNKNEFHGHPEWFRPDRLGRYTWDFLRHKDVPIECVDLSGSVATYDGLSNIVKLRELRELNLSRCAYIDDWALSRLHVWKDSLEVLSLAGCLRVTERGLASLHHLRNLKHLDVSDLPAVSHKGLVMILMEEMLPACEIVGIDYTDGLYTEDQPASPEPVI
ncbi:distal membrane-arm assembly complex protein 2-like isoform X5 [Eleutherodactylus coqui]|uniref:distal membrane-arm assembly complex protein 2-like isoform X5 n=1 Tax=Eleutherodactylus coqui TaxID=57060 RepID=UPI003461B0E2